MYIQYIYSAKTPLYYLLLIVFVKMVAFIFDITAFFFSFGLIRIVVGTVATATGENFDGPTDWNIKSSLLWEAKEWGKKMRSSVG